MRAIESLGALYDERQAEAMRYAAEARRAGARATALEAQIHEVPRGVIGCAGEIRHGIEMLRHWRGNAEAMGAWLNHIDRYSQRLTELLAEADRAEADRG